MKYGAYYDEVLLYGVVCYEDGKPAAEVIVLIDECLECGRLIKSDYCITNQFGEFCFQISNTEHYYRVKAFEKPITISDQTSFISNIGI